MSSDQLALTGLDEITKIFSKSIKINELNEVKIDGGEKHNKLNLGFHTFKDNHPGIITPLEEDVKQLGVNFRPAAQIFTQVPMTAMFNKLEPPEDIMKMATSHNMSIVIHSPYAINDFWKKNDLTKLHKSLENAEKYFDANNNLFKGLVVHLPKMVPEDVVNVIKNRKHITVSILLENHAYKPDDKSYELPSKLNKLTSLMIDANTPNWGYCIDTAHLFVCISQNDRLNGYKIEDRKDMERWLNELSDESRKKIKCWHLNGSVNSASSYKDKHSIPIFGENHLKADHIPDQIWGNLMIKNANSIADQVESLQESSLVPIFKHALAHDIPVILEINRGNANDIKACLETFAALEKYIKEN